MRKLRIGLKLDLLRTVLEFLLFLSIFNLALRYQKIPPLCKEAIFKSGNKCDTENYRPISIFSNFSKILEMILYEHMYPFIICRQIYMDKHGASKCDIGRSFKDI